MYFLSWNILKKNWIFFLSSFYVFPGLGSEVALLCSSCNEVFSHPWDLLVHVQKSHSLHIYEESDSDLISMSNVVSGINDQVVAPSHMLLDGPGVIKSIWFDLQDQPPPHCASCCSSSPSTTYLLLVSRLCSMLSWQSHMKNRIIAASILLVALACLFNNLGYEYG